MSLHLDSWSTKTIYVVNHIAAEDGLTKAIALLEVILNKLKDIKFDKIELNNEIKNMNIF